MIVENYERVKNRIRRLCYNRVRRLPGANCELFDALVDVVELGYFTHDQTTKQWTTPVIVQVTNWISKYFLQTKVLVPVGTLDFRLERLQRQNFESDHLIYKLL